MEQHNCFEGITTQRKFTCAICQARWELGAITRKWHNWGVAPYVKTEASVDLVRKSPLGGNVKNTAGSQ